MAKISGSGDNNLWSGDFLFIEEEYSAKCKVYEELD